MKKTIFVLVCFVLVNLLLTGCSVKSKTQTIQYQRKLQNYLPSNTTNTGNQKSIGTIDLSEGQKLRYDAKLGPGDLNFDIKIVNPY